MPPSGVLRVADVARTWLPPEAAIRAAARPAGPPCRVLPDFVTPDWIAATLDPAPRTRRRLQQIVAPDGEDLTSAILAGLRRPGWHAATTLRLRRDLAGVERERTDLLPLKDDGLSATLQRALASDPGLIVRTDAPMVSGLAGQGRLADAAGILFRLLSLLGPDPGLLRALAALPAVADALGPFAAGLREEACLSPIVNSAPNPAALWAAASARVTEALAGLPPPPGGASFAGLEEAIARLRGLHGILRHAALPPPADLLRRAAARALARPATTLHARVNNGRHAAAWVAALEVADSPTPSPAAIRHFRELVSIEDADLRLLAAVAAPSVPPPAARERGVGQDDVAAACARWLRAGNVRAALAAMEAAEDGPPPLPRTLLVLIAAGMDSTAAWHARLPAAAAERHPLRGDALALLVMAAALPVLRQPGTMPEPLRTLLALGTNEAGDEAIGAWLTALHGRRAIVGSGASAVPHALRDSLDALASARLAYPDGNRLIGALLSAPPLLAWRDRVDADTFALALDLHRAFERHGLTDAHLRRIADAEGLARPDGPARDRLRRALDHIASSAGAMIAGGPEGLIEARLLRQAATLADDHGSDLATGASALIRIVARRLIAEAEAASLITAG